MRFIHYSVAVFLIFYCLLYASESINGADCAGQHSQIKYPERECIVKVHSVNDKINLHNVLTTYNTYILSWYRSADFYRLRVPESITVTAFCKELQNNQFVQYAQPDYFVNYESDLNNTLHPCLWVNPDSTLYNIPAFLELACKANVPTPSNNHVSIDGEISNNATVLPAEIPDSKSIKKRSSAIIEYIYFAVSRGATTLELDCCIPDSRLLRDAIRFASGRGVRLINSCKCRYIKENDTLRYQTGKATETNTGICHPENSSFQDSIQDEVIINCKSSFKQDIVITDVKAPQWCLEGEQIQFIVTLKNEGVFEENIHLILHDSLYAQDISTAGCTLKPGETKKNILVWNTGKLSSGKHPVVINVVTESDQTPDSIVVYKDVTVVKDLRDVAVIGAEIVKQADSGKSDIAVQILNNGTYNEIVQVEIRSNNGSFEAIENAMVKARNDITVHIPCAEFDKTIQNDSLEIVVRTADRQEVNYKNNTIIIPID